MIVDFASIKVCKKMCLATLGLNEIMVYNWITESTHGLPKNSKHSFNKTINEISPSLRQEKVLYIPA